MSFSLSRATVAIVLLATAQPALANVITDWNEKAVALVQPLMPPPQGHRAMTMVNLAMFEAVNSVEHRYQPYLAQVDAAPAVLQDAAAAVAAATVLIGLLPQAEHDVKIALVDYLAAIPSGPAMTTSIVLGQGVAAAILAARANDGTDAPDAYRPRTSPGVYVPTAPPLVPMWPNVKPFAIAAAEQFRPEPPPKLDSAQWIADYDEIRQLGSRRSSKRSARQTEDARFWLLTGPRAYFPIVVQLIAARKMTELDSARFAALASMAMSDAILAVFDAKYHYEFWRPITAIRSGDLMKNPAIERDPVWQPIDSTPMHPEYPCAHCIVAAALAAVAGEIVGAGIPAISANSPTAPGVTHRWTDTRSFVTEVSQARIWAGFHYRFSTQVGADMGYRIGAYVAKNSLQPLPIATR